jgi:TolB-like protein/Flp pilus assembly protein TadD
MNELLARLKQRKLVQWAIAYVAFAFALLQGLDIVAQRFEWPGAIERYLILVLAVGLCVVLVIAWYHGERGVQRIGGTELLIIALLLAIGGTLIWRFGPAANTRVAPPTVSSVTPLSAQPIPAKSVAVLPFENLSADKNNAYFTDGIQDLILTKLADIGDLKVISRTSTTKYSSHPDDLKSIGRQLGVATILEGSVQKSGNRVLINVQLIDAKTDGHVWAESYTRTLDNIFGVEGEVAQKVADALKAKLSSAENAQLSAMPTQNRDAYDLFLRGEYLTRRGDYGSDTESWKDAIALYRQALGKDPDFALAYARLSYTQSLLAWFTSNVMDVEQLVEQARANAERALAMAPRLAAAQLALGYSEYYGAGDYPVALRTFEAALALQPNDAEALRAQGLIQRRMGRLDAATASFRRALELDPRNTQVMDALGQVRMMTGRYGEAEAWFQRALGVDPGDLNGRFWLALSVALAGGDIDRSLTILSGENGYLKLARATLLTWQRKYPQALALVASVPDTPANFAISDNGPKSLLLANLYRLQGNAARARPLYEQALAESRARMVRGTSIKHAIGWANVADAQIGLGDDSGAMDSIRNALAMVARSGDRIDGPEIVLFCAALDARIGRKDDALSLLGKALGMTGIRMYTSPAVLRIDPAWDPIRKDPRFQALFKKFAEYKPAANPVAPAPVAAASGGTHG